VTLSQFVDARTCLISGHKFIDLQGPEPALNLPGGLKSALRRPLRDHVYEVPKTFSLFTVV
jgi:hypothetical protein